MSSEYLKKFKITERKGELCVLFRLKSSHIDEITDTSPDGEEMIRSVPANTVTLTEDQLDTKIKNRIAGGEDMELEMEAMKALRDAKKAKAPAAPK